LNRAKGQKLGGGKPIDGGEGEKKPIMGGFLEWRENDSAGGKKIRGIFGRKKT